MLATFFAPDVGKINLQRKDDYVMSEPDFTVYDLAERQASGLEQSNLAGLEVYQELCRVRGKLATFPTEITPMGSQKENALALLQLRFDLENLVRTMSP